MTESQSSCFIRINSVSLGDAGIVDQDFYLSKALDHGFHGALDVSFIAYVHAKRRRLPAFALNLFCHRGQLFFIARCQRDQRAAFRQRQRARAANSLRSSCYQRNTPCYSRHFVFDLLGKS